MPVNEQELIECYRFRDASDTEDILIRQFLTAIQDLPARNRALDYFFKRTAPLAIIAIFVFCLYSGFTNGFRPGLVLVPLAIAATYGVEMFRVARQRWESSGIQYDFHKSGGHFLTASAVCTGKDIQKRHFGRRRFLVSARATGGKPFTQIPMIRSHYDAVQNGAHLFIIAAKEAEGFCFFALPQSFFPSGISRSSKKQPRTTPLKLRPMDESDRNLVLNLEKERIHIRRQLYLKNQLMVFGLSLAFLGYQIFRFYSDGIILGLFILLAASTMFVSDFLQDRQNRKALKGKGALLCTDAEASLSTDGSKPAILFKSKDNRLLFTSSLKDNLHWFHSGGSALLVYYDQENPTAYKLP